MLGPSDKSLGYCLPPFGLAATGHSTQNSEEPFFYAFYAFFVVKLLRL
jgi:hypothetical protein